MTLIFPLTCCQKRVAVVADRFALWILIKFVLAVAAVAWVGPAQFFIFIYSIWNICGFTVYVMQGVHGRAGVYKEEENWHNGK